MGSLQSRNLEIFFMTDHPCDATTYFLTENEDSESKLDKIRGMINTINTNGLKITANGAKSICIHVDEVMKTNAKNDFLTVLSDQKENVTSTKKHGAVKLVLFINETMSDDDKSRFIEPITREFQSFKRVMDMIPEIVFH